MLKRMTLVSLVVLAWVGTAQAQKPQRPLTEDERALRALGYNVITDSANACQGYGPTSPQRPNSHKSLADVERAWRALGYKVIQGEVGPDLPGGANFSMTDGRQSYNKPNAAGGFDYYTADGRIFLCLPPEVSGVTHYPQVATFWQKSSVQPAGFTLPSKR